MDKKPAPIIPSFAPENSDSFIDRPLTPARYSKRPTDVVTDPTLNPREKRAILSFWASDACAVESMPALRMPPGAENPVSFDEIMDALASLDRLHPSAVCDGGAWNHESPQLLDA